MNRVASIQCMRHRGCSTMCQFTPLKSVPYSKGPSANDVGDHQPQLTDGNIRISPTTPDSISSQTRVLKQCLWAARRTL